MGHQINARMKEMNCIGESRHQSKQEARENLGYEHNKTVGIHSYKTFDTYKSSCKQFTNYLKENHKGIKNIEDIKESHIKDYIKYREESGCSAYTYSKDLAALNKVFGTNLTKQDCDVATRSYKDISNNRELKEHHSHINYSNYRDEITILKATGMRRESLDKVNVDNFRYDSQGYPVAVKLVEKGGKYREAEIIRDYREDVKSVLTERLERNNYDREKPIFEHIPSRLGTHRFRQEYAKEVYDNYIKEHGTGTMKLADTNEKAYESDNRTELRGYDVAALKHTTQNLGHNRLDVVIYNYLGAKN